MQVSSLMKSALSLHKLGDVSEPTTIMYILETSCVFPFLGTFRGATPGTVFIYNVFSAIKMPGGRTENTASCESKAGEDALSDGSGTNGNGYKLH